MKTKKVPELILASILTVALGFAECGNKAAAGPEVKPVQRLSIGMFEQKTLDISEAEDSNSVEILTEVMEGLVRVENDGDSDIVRPGLAESWSISGDGLVYTFKLRNAKWTDGKPVTAQQFVDSWLRLLTPEKGFGNAYFAFDVKNARSYNAGEAKAGDVGVKAVDDKTFEVTLERSTPYFIKKIGFVPLFPIRIDEVEAQGEAYGSDFTRMSYCGPFKITEYFNNYRTILEKNEAYWDRDKVKLNKIEMQIYMEVLTQMQMFESKEIDIIGSPGESIEFYRARAKTGELTQYTSVTPTTFCVTYNLRTGGPSGLMTNKKIRQALSYIIDREDIVKNVYDRYMPAYGFVPYKIQIGDKEYRKDTGEPMKGAINKYDTIEKINALLKEGLVELGKDPDASYKVVLLTNGLDTLSKSKQEYYQNTFQKLGNIKVELLIAADTNKFWTLEDEAKVYDMALSSWKGDFDDPMAFMDMWVTDGGSNFKSYSNDEYDEIMNDKILNETDNEKRKDLYVETEGILLDDMPIAPIFYSDSSVFMHNYVKGIQFPLFGAMYEMKYAYREER